MFLMRKYNSKDSSFKVGLSLRERGSGLWLGLCLLRRAECTRLKCVQPHWNLNRSRHVYPKVTTPKFQMVGPDVKIDPQGARGSDISRLVIIRGADFACQAVRLTTKRESRAGVSDSLTCN
jgi:hypothetical protein